MAEQLIGTKGMSRRELLLWMTRAKSSFPVPVSPSRRTLLGVSATFLTSAMMSREGAVFTDNAREIVPFRPRS